ncbi:phospholipase D-like domain-containing protein [Planomicrobium sp. Y74]|uniref:phospholipase D-like domain-containing protein n=1 Tax=Planomicrobium sp. Y74 TaxID=2478977 RepID=UPI000EF51E58|nr:phospholipase D-like domain-containing protein [Planomicrobium sp. Y74]RLQ90217.1 hypothetical protein D9754_10815 [Planomicrobium sp. Y74]
MDFKSPRMYVLAEHLGLNFETKNTSSHSDSLRALKKIFPDIGSVDIQRLLALMEIQHDLHSAQNLQMEIVVTAPSEVLNKRRTIGVLRESIENAEKSILLTGYSVSEFVSEIIALLIKKSTNGVKVKFFIDKNVDSEIFSAANSSSNFELYEYRSDKYFSSMHAKIIVIDDEKAFISSSNLSYNGIINNLEMGIVINGDPIREFKGIFEELITTGYFVKVN